MDNNSFLTLQNQLKKEFYEKIANKEWLPGQRIPSEKELCEEYGVSRITVREALRELVEANYIVRKQGKGTFVAAPTVEYTLSSVFSLSKELEARGLESKFTILNYQEIEPAEFYKNTFKISSDETIICLTRVRTINGEAYAYEESVVPRRYLEGAIREDINQFGLYPTMKKCSGFFPEYANEAVEAVICPNEVAQAMGIQAKSAVFRIDRYTFAKEKCVEHCKSFVYGQRYNSHHIIRQR